MFLSQCKHSERSLGGLIRHMNPFNINRSSQPELTLTLQLPRHTHTRDTNVPTCVWHLFHPSHRCHTNLFRMLLKRNQPSGKCCGQIGLAVQVLSDTTRRIVTWQDETSVNRGDWFIRSLTDRWHVIPRIRVDGCQSPVLLDNIGPVVLVEFGEIIPYRRRAQDVSSLLALTYFRGLRSLCGAPPGACFGITYVHTYVPRGRRWRRWRRYATAHRSLLRETWQAQLRSSGFTSALQTHCRERLNARG